MKKLIIFFSSILFAFNIQNIVGQEKYQNYNNLIKSIVPQNASIKEAITILKANGLIDLFFDETKTIHPTFIFVNNNPLFDLKILNSTLFNLGYAYFYPSRVQKGDTFKVEMRLKSNHFIDPVNFINAIEKQGCEIVDVEKKDDFIYTLDCSGEKLDAIKLSDKLKSYLNVKGSYLFDAGDFSKIYVSTSRLDLWYPYIVFYDDELNIISIYSKKNIQRKVVLDIPEGTKYVKIEDNFIKSHFKRGIFIKGIK